MALCWDGLLVGIVIYMEIYSVFFRIVDIQSQAKEKHTEIFPSKKLKIFFIDWLPCNGDGKRNK